MVSLPGPLRADSPGTLHPPENPTHPGIQWAGSVFVLFICAPTCLFRHVKYILKCLKSSHHHHQQQQQFRIHYILIIFFVDESTAMWNETMEIIVCKQDGRSQDCFVWLAANEDKDWHDLNSSFCLPGRLSVRCPAPQALRQVEACAASVECAVYQWEASAWGSCTLLDPNTQCGHGIQHREVGCYTPTGTQMVDQR